MDPFTSLDGGMTHAAALASAVAVFLVILLAVEHMLGKIANAADVFRGRDRCRFCGTPLDLMPDGLGHEPRCRRCGRNQPWSG